MKCEKGSTVVVRTDPAGAADDPAARAGDQLDPDLVGIDRSLAEGMADPKRPDDDLDQVFPPGLSVGTVGPERAQAVAVDRASVAQAEDVDSHFLVAQETGVASRRPRHRRSIAARPVLAPMNEVVVDLAAPLAVEVPGAEVGRGLELHVAVGAARLGDVGVVEASGPVARDAREQERVVVVLAADEVLVVVHAERACRPCGRSSRTRASLMTGLRNVFLCISGLALTSVWLIHCRSGLSLVANG